MPTVFHRDPVVIRHPNANGFSISVKRGDEFADDDPIVTAFPWLFVETPTAEPVASVTIPKTARKK